MKTPLIIFLSFFFGINIFGQLKEVDLSREIQAVLDIKDSQDKEIIYQALRKLDNQVIYSWSQRAPFTEEQLKQSIQTQLEPIETQLIEYAQTEDHGLKGRSASLLGYSRPVPKAIEALYKIALETKYDKTQSDVIATAVDSIYSLGKANATLEQSIIKRLSMSLTNLYGQYRFWASEAGHWEIEKSVPVLIEGLKSDEIDLVSSAEALKLMGSKAKEALPELKNQLEKAKAKKAEFKVIEALTFAIQVIEKDMMKKEGILGLSTTTNQMVANISTNTKFNQSVANVSIPKNESQKTENSSWLKWMLLGIGLLIVVGLGVKFLKQKKQDSD